ncbi:MAG: hypothetical protein IJS39_04525 [Synergistaceae bacterium]|nr:hypothetical protein [Synergistaceae bacterium]
MIQVKVKANNSALGALQDLPKAARLAVLNAHRSAVSELKKLAISETVSKYYLTKGQITKAMKSTPTGFKVSSGMLSLDKYKLTPKKRTKKYTLKGAVKRDSGLQPLGRNAFLMGTHPVSRLTKRRFPTKVITGPSIAQAVGNDETGELLQERAEELFSAKVNEALARLGAVKRG